MKQAEFTICPVLSKNGRINRLLAATCAAAFLAVAGLSMTGMVQPAVAQTNAPLDTTKLPRPAAIRQLAAFPQTTIILSAESVSVATKSALALLEASGWQRYLGPTSQVVQQPTSETHQLKRGSQALTLFVAIAPAHNNATSISYSEVPLNGDLAFHSKATDIRFSPSPLHLDAKVPMAPDALLAYYRAELSTAGWALHSASDGSAPMRVTTGAGMQHAFFTHGSHGAIHVTAKAADSGTSTIAIRAVPASVLPGAQVAQMAQAPVAAVAQPNPHEMAHAQMNRQVDAMAQDLMKQALQPPPKGAGIEAALAAARNAGVTINMPGKPQTPAVASAAPAREAVNEPALERDEVGGFPVPKASSSKAQERTPFRVEIHAAVNASPASVLAFYRRELVTLGWKETAPAKVDAQTTIVTYRSEEGPAVLTLTRKGKETTISLLQRKETEARKSGLMPKAGQAKIMFGSMMDGDSTVLVGGRTIKLAPGIGSKKPDGPSLDVAPGTHKVTVKSPGKPDVVEMVSVRADEIWGVLLGPGGALSLPIY